MCTYHVLCTVQCTVHRYCTYCSNGRIYIKLTQINTWPMGAEYICPEFVINKY